MVKLNTMGKCMLWREEYCFVLLGYSLLTSLTSSSNLAIFCETSLSNTWSTENILLLYTDNIKYIALQKKNQTFQLKKERRKKKHFFF